MWVYVYANLYVYGNTHAYVHANGYAHVHVVYVYVYVHTLLHICNTCIDRKCHRYCTHNVHIPYMSTSSDKQEPSRHSTPTCSSLNYHRTQLANPKWVKTGEPAATMALEVEGASLFPI